MKMTISGGKCLKKKNHVSVCKEVHDQKLCNLKELYTAFKEKQPNVNIGSSKFCALRPKRRALTSSKMAHSVCVCTLIKTLCC